MELQEIKHFFRPLHNGSGYGSGYGIKLFNKQKVYIIDKVPTIISTIKKDIAFGFILQNDLTIKKCVVARNDYHFSHGDTLKDAIKSLEDKTLISLPIPKRIDNFKKRFKSFKHKYKASLLYDWHFKLTGSCKTGRDNFCINHNINLVKDKFSVYEFIELTKNQYGSEIIKQLI